ncbi:double-strand break repair protein AddB [Flavisphingomonas formosensis]|uniref:double-strand break repair protein AddB n=1 Tax=Flavisphingomonas formosensis TaxID=861534 RepID=UPI0012F8061B|nr:double-strand break repair protein AddB [Sphingomonas formosensis]
MPSVYTIPPHRAFADALAAGVLARFGGGPLGLARGTILLPNNRAVLAITNAFVRRAEGGLLLPRLVPIGDPELDDRIGSALDTIDAADAIPPAIAPLQRRMLLARLVQQARQAAGEPVDAAEAVRLAADLGRTLDQMLVEQIPLRRLEDVVGAELTEHWQRSLGLLRIILDRWPEELARLGRIELADRRNRLLDRIAQSWLREPPDGFVVAAGITTAAPAVARLLRAVADLPNGLVILPALDIGMADEEWDALGPHEPEPVSGQRRRAIETHPQFQLKLLLDRMSVGRGEVQRWRWGGGRDAPAARTRAIRNAMAPAEFTGRWQTLPRADRSLPGVHVLELATPAEEAQAIALAMREALETPERTVALVTPDRGLARRVAAHLVRWGIEADDSAGRPLSTTASGTLLLAIAEAVAEDFAPVALLSLLKHPLVRAGDGRGTWLAGVRMLDRALRGPRPAAGLEGIRQHLLGGEGRQAKDRRAALAFWQETLPLLAQLGEAARQPTLAGQLQVLRDGADALAGDAAWSQQAGRAVGDLLTELQMAAPDGPEYNQIESLAPLLKGLMDEVAVRPPRGQHPRIFIWGLIEARLQHADLMILGGLNEGTWPALPSPDPWLAPRIRADLGLPGLERRIGLAAHDFATALGARELVITRARRDARAPAIASRFWLRLEAMTGGLARAHRFARWTQALDRPDRLAPARRPNPSPPRDARPQRIAVTDLDRLKADPFAFYARTMLGLAPWEAVDADPGPAWRGTAVHAVFEAWMREDGCDPARLRPRAEAMLTEVAAHPVLRALWTPRLLEAIDWAASEMQANLAGGRVPATAEIFGEAEVAGITLYGKVDRIDRLPDGSLAIVDYKTGKAPSAKEIEAGYSMQLGLLGLIAEHGGFKDQSGTPGVFEYWSLARGKDGKLGHVSSPVGGKAAIAAADFTHFAAAQLTQAVERWLTGTEAFVAKLHPERAPFPDYDQLMRLDEWYGALREGE